MTALPSWDQFMVPVLRLHTDGEVRSLRSIRTGVASATLTEDQRAEVLPSGSAKSDNRIGWAVSYLYRVGALERQARGQYRITDIGRRVLADHPQGITGCSCASTPVPATPGGWPRPTSRLPRRR